MKQGANCALTECGDSEYGRRFRKKLGYARIRLTA